MAEQAGSWLGFLAQAAGDAAQGAAQSAGEAAGGTGAAEGGAAGGAAGGGAAGGQPVSLLQQILYNPLTLFAGLMFLFYALVLMPERRKQAEVARRRAALKKNDRVITSGGIYGTVVSTAADSNEITLRVDESNNTRIRVLRSAIATVLEADKEKKADASG